MKLFACLAALLLFAASPAYSATPLYRVCKVLTGSLQSQFTTGTPADDKIKTRKITDKSIFEEFNLNRNTHEIVYDAAENCIRIIPNSASVAEDPKILFTFGGSALQSRVLTNLKAKSRTAFTGIFADTMWASSSTGTIFENIQGSALLRYYGVTLVGFKSEHVSVTAGTTDPENNNNDAILRLTLEIGKEFVQTP